MAFNLNEQITRGKEIIASAGPSKLAVGGVLLAAATAVLLVTLFWGGENTTYDVLYSQLTAADAGAITTELQTQNIPYRLSTDGTTIEIDKNLVAQTRLALAVQGLPSKGNIGFEIFDEQKLGVTDMVQKTNLQRAVQGELERTLMSMPEISMARVHVSVPKDTLFIQDQMPPAASVVIKTRPGSALTKPQLMGIVNLVVSSVNGLSPEHVSIIDTDGGLIWSADMQKPGFLNDDQMKQKAAYEDNIKRSIQAMMERVVGPERAITRVIAELDFKEVITNEDIYDPERTAVRSEQRIAERSIGAGPTASGVPNATYELGTANRQNSGATGVEEYSRTEETSNYEITNIKRQTVAKAGDLKKISVAVLLDGIYSENAAGEMVFTALPQDLLDQLENSIKAAVGFDEARGDTVSVTSVPFARSEEVSVWALFILELVREFSRPVLNMILIILFFFLVVRPIINWLKKEVEPVGSGGEAAILPQQPGGTYNYGDPLPLPTQAAPEDLAPAGAATIAAASQVAELSQEDDEELEPDYDESEEEALNYDDEEEAAQATEDDEPLTLAYGNLSRENILPLARENLDRTVGLVRSWIDEKPPQEEPKL